MEPGVFVLSAAAISGLAGFTAWLVKDYIGNLKSQVREANKRTETVTSQARENGRAMTELTTTVRELLTRLGP